MASREAPESTQSSSLANQANQASQSMISSILRRFFYYVRTELDIIPAQDPKQVFSSPSAPSLEPSHKPAIQPAKGSLASGNPNSMGIPWAALGTSQGNPWAPLGTPGASLGIPRTTLGTLRPKAPFNKCFIDICNIWSNVSIFH